MTRLRTYSELLEYETFEDRFRYLALGGGVADPTFGHDRYLNQDFYRSRVWKQIRNHVIYRDNGCDLGIEGYEIHHEIVVHHMNPMRVEDLLDYNEDVLDPEFLITTTHVTHNAIHYGDGRKLPRQFVERVAGDTKLW